MSALELFGRPYVVFDPTNRQHRAYYHQFVKTATWGHCPVRFVVPEDHGDLVTMIQRSLVKFYVEREFKDVVKEQQAPLVRQKKKKTVDIKTKR
jgi:hypothetical protein